MQKIASLYVYYIDVMGGLIHIQRLTD